MKAVFLLVLMLASAHSVEEMPLDKFTIIDAVYKVETIANGTEHKIIKRYVLKDVVVFSIGARTFVGGKTPSENNILIAGSNWGTICIPVDQIVVMAGTNNPQFLVQKEGVSSMELGAIIK